MNIFIPYLVGSAALASVGYFVVAWRSDMIEDAAVWNRTNEKLVEQETQHVAIRCLYENWNPTEGDEYCAQQIYGHPARLSLVYSYAESFLVNQASAAGFNRRHCDPGTYVDADELIPQMREFVRVDLAAPNLTDQAANLLGLRRCLGFRFGLDNNVDDNTLAQIAQDRFGVWGYVLGSTRFNIDSSEQVHITFEIEGFDFERSRANRERARELAIVEKFR